MTKNQKKLNWKLFYFSGEIQRIKSPETAKNEFSFDPVAATLYEFIGKYLVAET